MPLTRHVREIPANRSTDGCQSRTRGLEGPGLWPGAAAGPGPEQEMCRPQTLLIHVGQGGWVPLPPLAGQWELALCHSFVWQRHSQQLPGSMTKKRTFRKQQGSSPKALEPTVSSTAREVPPGRELSAPGSTAAALSVVSVLHGADARGPLFSKLPSKYCFLY